jgi:hypothetical protein
MLARNARWREDTLCNDDGEPKMLSNGLFSAEMALKNNAHDTIEKNDIIFTCLVGIKEAALLALHCTLMRVVVLAVVNENSLMGGAIFLVCYSLEFKCFPVAGESPATRRGFWTVAVRPRSDCELRAKYFTSNAKDFFAIWSIVTKNRRILAPRKNIKMSNSAYA